MGDSNSSRYHSYGHHKEEMMMKKSTILFYTREEWQKQKRNKFIYEMVRLVLISAMIAYIMSLTFPIPGGQ